MYMYYNNGNQDEVRKCFNIYVQQTIYSCSEHCTPYLIISVLFKYNFLLSIVNDFGAFEIINTCSYVEKTVSLRTSNVPQNYIITQTDRKGWVSIHLQQLCNLKYLRSLYQDHYVYNLFPMSCTRECTKGFDYAWAVPTPSLFFMLLLLSSCLPRYSLKTTTHSCQGQFSTWQSW